MYSIDTMDVFYFDEVYQRMLYYPPPFWLGGWYYIPPWLWIDGNKHSDCHPSWEDKIAARMSQPSPVAITMWGNYDPAGDTGTVYAQFRNDSTATIDGRVIFVITEDSIYYFTPYIEWHNQIPRDYLPDHEGVIVSILPGDSVILSQPFTIEQNWNVDFCKVLTWIQSDSMQVDSTKEIWQGALSKVTDLGPGVEEIMIEEIHLPMVNTSPNPCVDNTEIVFGLPAESEYHIDIYDITGRRVKTLRGLMPGGRESIRWNLRDDTGTPVRAGVYLYRFTSDVLNTFGKVVVR